jgi:hypothetical protein
MDTDFRIDIGEVKRAIVEGEIIALYFPLLRKTLLMDTRRSVVDGPMIRVVPMASSPEERLRELGRLRPRFPRPDKITIIPWPKYVATLVRSQVWDTCVRRFLEIGPSEVVRQCEACLDELRAAEREEIRRAITGDNYETLWDTAGTHITQEEAEVDDEDPDGP